MFSSSRLTSTRQVFCFGLVWLWLSVEMVVVAAGNLIAAGRTEVQKGEARSQLLSVLLQLTDGTRKIFAARGSFSSLSDARLPLSLSRTFCRWSQGRGWRGSVLECWSSSNGKQVTNEGKWGVSGDSDVIRQNWRCFCFKVGPGSLAHSRLKSH